MYYLISVVIVVTNVFSRSVVTRVHNVPYGWHGPGRGQTFAKLAFGQSISIFDAKHLKLFYNFNPV